MSQSMTGAAAARKFCRNWSSCCARDGQDNILFKWKGILFEAFLFADIQYCWNAFLIFGASSKPLLADKAFPKLIIHA